MAAWQVPLDDLPKLVEPGPCARPMSKAFRELGFKYVTLRPRGFRSGVLNALIPLDALQPTLGASSSFPETKISHRYTSTLEACHFTPAGSPSIHALGRTRVVADRFLSIPDQRA